ncbi:hypothetical protein ACLBXM_20415 [Xanthobacteraceae bacterium A53D]
MPTLRRRRTERRPPLTEDQTEWLRGSSRTDVDLFETDDQQAALWQTNGAAVVAEHIRQWPGTRPRRWWQLEAPGARERVGGTGTALFPDRNLRFGLPLLWEGVDPADPPTFESEAAYLKRHGLLTADEKRRLSSADFEPVALPTVPRIPSAAAVRGAAPAWVQCARIRG